MPPNPASTVEVGARFELQEEPSIVESIMAVDEMFDSSVRSAGDLAGVFEYDGETGYFYLYKNERDSGQKVMSAIRIVDGDPDFKQEDISIRWDAAETRVGL